VRTRTLLAFGVLELLCVGFVAGFLAASALAVWVWRKLRRKTP
jgi:hypothetical protein